MPQHHHNQGHCDEERFATVMLLDDEDIARRGMTLTLAASQNIRVVAESRASRAPLVPQSGRLARTHPVRRCGGGSGTGGQSDVVTPYHRADLRESRVVRP
ncbi:hypothetical protein GCM10009753_27950 [Streptantibioticus ferralitis]